MESHEQKVDRVIALIRGKRLGRDSAVYVRCLEWLGYWPQEVPEVKKLELIRLVCAAFSVPEAELLRDITFGRPTGEGREEVEEDGEKVLRALLPRGGWFEWYDEYTRQTEAPLSFHLFCGLGALGTAMGRRAWLEMAHWRIYPNYNVIIVGPTGRVKKTTAINIARGLVIKAMTCPVMADQMTPEAFLESLVDGGGHQFIYAPEFTDLFNRQRYNDGFTIKIIRMLDCPDIYRVKTISRGERDINEVALSILGGSTMSLLAKSSPVEVTSSGFLNRFIIVIENDTSRCFPEPGKGTPEVEAKLLEQIKRLKSFSGPFTMSPEMRAAYAVWYKRRAKVLRGLADETMAEVLERGSDHLLRTAMLVHAVQCDNQVICEECFHCAVKMMEYVESKAPLLVSGISQNLSAQESEYVLESIRRLGGAVDHSKILRRVSHRMDAQAFKRHIHSLVESKRVKEEKRGQLTIYVATEVKDEH